MDLRTLTLCGALLVAGCAEEADLCEEGFGEDATGECVPLGGMDGGGADGGGGVDGGDGDGGDEDDGGPGDAAPGDAGPCGNACASPTPFCVNDACVACRDHTDCTDIAMPRCDANNACAPCSETEGCDRFMGMTVCNELANPNECVECVTSDQCTQPGLPTCDPATNTCVQCTVATQDADCGVMFACAPRTLTCSAQTRNAQDSCEECESDDDCFTDGRDLRCVDTAFMGTSTGARCLPRYDGSLCPKGTQRIVTSVTSLGGTGGPVMGDFCFPESDTSCPAQRAYLDSLGTCATAAECGLGVGDGICDTTCTVPCGANRDCPGPASNTCNTALGQCE